MQFTTAYYMPVQNTCNVLLPIKYLHSRRALATTKTSCAIHMCWPRTTHRLSTWYLQNTPPIPQGGGGGKVDPRWFINMLATYDCILPYTLVAPVIPSPNPPHRGGEGKVDPTCVHMGPWHDRGGGGVAGLSHMYIYIYAHTHISYIYIYIYI